MAALGGTVGPLDARAQQTLAVRIHSSETSDIRAILLLHSIDGIGRSGLRSGLECFYESVARHSSCVIAPPPLANVIYPRQMIWLVGRPPGHLEVATA